jgi:hypothetical protein
MLKYVLIACVIALTACSRKSPPRDPVYEITGDRTKRVASVSVIIARQQPPPTAILDAHLVEEQLGDGEMGPSDFRTFCVLEVAPLDVPPWTQLLTPIAARVEYAAPAEPRDWWIARDAFASLQFYEPDPLTGRLYGWIGVSPQTGRIYIFSFTT